MLPAIAGSMRRCDQDGAARRGTANGMPPLAAPANYSLVITSFNDIDATADAIMMTATAVRPKT
jgi:hypothetical protein